MNRIQTLRSLWGFSRRIAVPGLPNGHPASTRFITNAYYEDSSKLSDQTASGSTEERSQAEKKLKHQSNDEFPEFKVEAGEAPARLRSTNIGRLPMTTLHEESFAFQEQADVRENVMRRYWNEKGEMCEKWDMAEEEMERTWRDDRGRPVEERREKEIRTTGFPEAFHPRPQPHSDPTVSRSPEPIPKRHDEMHLPNRSVGTPDTKAWEQTSTRVQAESETKWRN